MNYFTPERFARLQERSSREAAEREWEQAAEEYASHLRKLLHKLPKQVCQFIESGSLHDAGLLVMWTERTNVLRMILQKEREASHILDLNYRLAEPPRINRVALPMQYCSTSATWLYDELDIVPRRKKLVEKNPIFQHNILFSNGWEACLRFQRVSIHRNPALQAVISQPA